MEGRGAEALGRKVKSCERKIKYKRLGGMDPPSGIFGGLGKSGLGG